MMSGADMDMDDVRPAMEANPSASQDEDAWRSKVMMDVDDETVVEEEEEENQSNDATPDAQEKERASWLARWRIEHPAERMDAIETVIEAEDENSEEILSLKRTREYFLKYMEKGVEAARTENSELLSEFFAKIRKYYRLVMTRHYNDILANPRQKFTSMALSHLKTVSHRVKVYDSLERCTMPAMWVDGPIKEGMPLHRRLVTMRDRTVEIVDAFLVDLEERKRMEWRVHEAREALTEYGKKYPRVQGPSRNAVFRVTGKMPLSSDEHLEFHSMVNGARMDQFWTWERTMISTSIEMLELRFGRNFGDLQEHRFVREAEEAGDAELSAHLARMYRQKARDTDVERRKMQFTKAVKVTQHLHWLPRGIAQSDLNDTERRYMAANAMANAIAVASFAPENANFNSDLETCAMRRGVASGNAEVDMSSLPRPVTVADRMRTIRRAMDGSRKAEMQTDRVMKRMLERFGNEAETMQSGAKRRRRADEPDERPAQARRVHTEDPVSEPIASMPTHAREIFRHGEGGLTCEVDDAFGDSLGFDRYGVYETPEMSDDFVPVAGSGRHLHYQEPRASARAKGRESLFTDDEMREMREVMQTPEGRMQVLGEEAFFSTEDRREAWRSIQRMVALRRRVEHTASLPENTPLLNDMMSNNLDLDTFLDHFGIDTKLDDPGKTDMSSETFYARFAETLETMYRDTRDTILNPALYGVKHTVTREEVPFVVEAVRLTLASFGKSHPVLPEDRDKVSPRLAYQLIVDAKARIASLIDNVQRHLSPSGTEARLKYNEMVGKDATVAQSGAPTRSVWQWIRQGGSAVRDWTAEKIARLGYDSSTEVELEANEDYGRPLYVMGAVAISGGIAGLIKCTGYLKNFNLLMNSVSSLRIIYASAPEREGQVDKRDTLRKLMNDADNAMKPSTAKLMETIDEAKKNLKEFESKMTQLSDIGKFFIDLSNAAFDQLVDDITRLFVASSEKERIERMIRKTGSNSDEWEVDLTELQAFVDDFHMIDNALNGTLQMIKHDDFDWCNTKTMDQKKAKELVQEYAQRIGLFVNVRTGRVKIQSLLGLTKTSIQLLNLSGPINEVVARNPDAFKKSDATSDPNRDSLRRLELIETHLNNSPDMDVVLKKDENMQPDAFTVTFEPSIRDPAFKNGEQARLSFDINMRYIRDIPTLVGIDKLTNSTNEKYIDEVRKNLETLQEQINTNAQETSKLATALLHELVKSQIINKNDVERAILRDIMEDGSLIAPGQDETGKDRTDNSLWGLSLAPTCQTLHRTIDIGRSQASNVSDTSNGMLGTGPNNTENDSSGDNPSNDMISMARVSDEAIAQRLLEWQSRLKDVPNINTDLMNDVLDKAVTNMRIVAALSMAAKENGEVDLKIFNASQTGMQQSQVFSESENKKLGSWSSIIEEAPPLEVRVMREENIPKEVRSTIDQNRTRITVSQFLPGQPVEFVFDYDKDDNATMYTYDVIKGTSFLTLDPKETTDEELEEIAHNLKNNPETWMSPTTRQEVEQQKVLRNTILAWNSVNNVATLGTMTMDLISYIGHKVGVIDFPQAMIVQPQRDEEEVASSIKRGVQDYKEFENMAATHAIDTFNRNGLRTTTGGKIANILLNLREAMRSVSRRGLLKAFARSFMSVRSSMLRKAKQNLIQQLGSDAVEVATSLTMPLLYDYVITPLWEGMLTNPIIVKLMVAVGVGASVGIASLALGWKGVGVIAWEVTGVLWWACAVNFFMWYYHYTPFLKFQIGPIYQSALYTHMNSVLFKNTLKWTNMAASSFERYMKTYGDLHYDANRDDIQAMMYTQNFAGVCNAIWPMLGPMPVNDPAFRQTLFNYVGMYTVDLRWSRYAQWAAWVTAVLLLKGRDIQSVLNSVFGYEVPVIDRPANALDWLLFQAPNTALSPEAINRFTELVKPNITINPFTLNWTQWW